MAKFRHFWSHFWWVEVFLSSNIRKLHFILVKGAFGYHKRMRPIPTLYILVLQHNFDIILAKTFVWVSREYASHTYFVYFSFPT